MTIYNKRTLHANRHGFTLVEISIVLIIIGLVLGGIIVGNSMIRSAEILAQIKQINEYNTAVKTFKMKYGLLPGDLSADRASAYGFISRAGTKGRGNGDYIITAGASSIYDAFYHVGGETVMFWRDLSDANLISDVLKAGSDLLLPAETSREIVKTYLPKTKISSNAHIFVNTGYHGNAMGPLRNKLYIFSLSIGDIDEDQNLNAESIISPGISYAIDSKLDDGRPREGFVVASDHITGFFVAANDKCILTESALNKYNLAPIYINNPLCIVHFLND